MKRSVPYEIAVAAEVADEVFEVWKTNASHLSPETHDSIYQQWRARELDLRVDEEEWEKLTIPK